MAEKRIRSTCLFFILATQNPIEQAGTYPLPEAQLDRFLLYIKIGYPTAQEEVNILQSTTSNKRVTINPVIDGNEIKQLQSLVRDVRHQRGAGSVCIRSHTRYAA